MNILLVEDNPGDVGLIREAFATCDVAVEFSIASDGLEALARLKVNNGRPDLILLDLNLPRMDGRELLEKLKADPDLRRIPVVVLTSSNAPRDIARAYDLHANCYLVKPSEFSEIEEVARRLTEFWLETVRLPDR